MLLQRWIQRAASYNASYERASFVPVSTSVVRIVPEHLRLAHLDKAVDVHAKSFAAVEDHELVMLDDNVIQHNQSYQISIQIISKRIERI